VKGFLLNNYFFITHFVEIMAALAGIYSYKKYKHTVVKYFIWFLVYIAVLELIGAYPRFLRDFEFLREVEVYLKGTKFEKNHWWYTIFWGMGSPMFYSFYFQNLIKSKKNTRWLYYSTLVFFVFCMVIIASNWDIFFVASFPGISVFGAAIILMSIVFYFLEILQSDRILSFNNSINFYISTVLLIWFLVITPLVFYQIYYAMADWSFIFLRWQIYLTLNIFMYSTFSIALLWCKPQNN